MALFVVDKQRLSSSIEINDVWNILTKCKDKLENGHRLEYLFWRIWGRKSLNMNLVIDNIYKNKPFVRSKEQSLNSEPLNLASKTSETLLNDSWNTIATDAIHTAITASESTKVATETILEATLPETTEINLATNNTDCSDSSLSTNSGESCEISDGDDKITQDSIKMKIIHNDYKELAKSLSRERSRLEAEKYFHHKKSSPEKGARKIATVEKLDDLKVYGEMQRRNQGTPSPGNSCKRVLFTKAQKNNIPLELDPFLQNEPAFPIGLNSESAQVQSVVGVSTSQVEQNVSKPPIQDGLLQDASSKIKVSSFGSDKKAKSLSGSQNSPLKHKLHPTDNPASLKPMAESKPSKANDNPFSEEADNKQNNIQFYISDESSYDTSYDSDISDISDDDENYTSPNSSYGEEKDKKFKKSELLPSHKRPSLLSVAIQRNHFSGRQLHSKEGIKSKEISASLEQNLTIDHHMCINRSKSDLYVSQNPITDTDYW